MKIDLSAKEIDMLDAALVAWQKQPETEGFGGALMGAMFRGMTRKEGILTDPEDEPKNIMEKHREDSRQRERKALLLRAKLQQALATNSEHEIESEIAH